ncbi:MAG: hypothetical protein SF162_15040 [bacterium]|nr:hypothetical protein [bacterium]
MSFQPISIQVFTQRLMELIGTLLEVPDEPGTVQVDQVLCTLSIAFATLQETGTPFNDGAFLDALKMQPYPAAFIAGVESLLAMRRASAAFDVGSRYRILEHPDPLLLIERTAADGGERALILHNVGDAAVPLELPPGRWNHLSCPCPVADGEITTLEPLQYVWIVER